MRVWRYAAVFIPMAVLNVVGSIQNLESAEAAGDKFDTRSSLLANGISAVVGVFLGNPFAPTIYIGHPGWKALGARTGYSVLNAVAVMVDLLYRRDSVPDLVDADRGDAWHPALDRPDHHRSGLSGSSQRSHALAVAIGFIPALAAMGRVDRGNERWARPDGGYALKDVADQFPARPLISTACSRWRRASSSSPSFQRHPGQDHRPQMAGRRGLVPDRCDRDFRPAASSMAFFGTDRALSRT